jgi:CBS domain-containing membrane protein
MLTATKIEEIMTKNVFTIGLDDTVHNADELMKRENLRFLPVLDGKKLIGLITERTIMEFTLRKLYDFDDEFGEEGHNKITDFRTIMVKDVIFIYPEDSVRKAVEKMAKKKVDCLPVVDWENNLVGIVTSTDIYLYILNKIF